MGKIREVDAISNAIIETEKEIAGNAWDIEETEPLDASGDQSLESMGDGLEGQHDPEGDEDPEAEEAEGDEESEGEEEAEGEAAPKVTAETTGEPKPKVEAEEPRGRVPSAKLREANERARAAEAERDALKAERERSAADRTLADKLDLAMREIAALKSSPRTETKVEPPKPEAVPDIFEDPKGFVDHITKGFQTELSRRDEQIARQRAETSFAIAHAFHKESFEKAWGAINQLNPGDPEVRSTVQRIYNSPNPGEALVSWHKREQTRSEVGDDVVAYRDRVAKETREALMKDPEFRKQLVAELRGEAQAGNDGQPRTTTRLPQSLNRAAGSNLGATRGDPHQYDDSPRAIADAAWR